MANDRPSPPAGARVVFVCQHGNVKSLMASRWFDRMASEAGLSARGLSRGLEPESPVPPAIVERLAADGFDVRDFEAEALAPADVDGAARVVLIGVAPPAWMKGSGAPVESWNDIPPASDDYVASRDAMRERIASLLKGRAGSGHP